MSALSFVGKKKVASCGLDLGSNWVKLVRVVPAGRNASLDRVGRMPWGTTKMEDVDAAGALLGQFWQAHNIKDKVVTSSMAGHAVIIKRVNFPSASAKELKAGIQKEAKQYIPFDIQDVYMDYQVMGPGEEENSVEVLLVASKKKMVQELQKVVSKAGLGLSAVDVDAFALANCFEYSYPEYGDEPSYLLDIGGQQSVFCVFWKKQPAFLREVGFGGQQVTDDIAKTLGVSRQEAEKVKINGPEGLSEEQQAEVGRAVNDLMTNWSDELKRLIGFYQSSMPEAELSKRLFLAGGGSLLAGLAEKLQNDLGLETTYLDPWRKVKVADDKFDPEFLQAMSSQYVVPMGLALRSLAG